MTPLPNGMLEARMLVLDRRNFQGFWIGGSIFVRVLAIGAHRVKLGVEAPDGLLVLRDELLDPEVEPNTKPGAL